MTGSDRQRVDWRIKLTAAIGGTVGVLMLLLDMEPRLVLVAMVALAVGAAFWLAYDLGHVAAPLTWHDYGASEADSARPDQRTQALRSRLERNTRGRRNSFPSPSPTPSGKPEPEPFDEIIDTLLAAIDDHLVASHGLDRTATVDALSAALSPELARFVSDPAAQRAMTQRRSLARTVALIEDLPRTPA